MSRREAAHQGIRCRMCGHDVPVDGRGRCPLGHQVLDPLTSEVTLDEPERFPAPQPEVADAPPVAPPQPATRAASEPSAVQPAQPQRLGAAAAMPQEPAATEPVAASNTAVDDLLYGATTAGPSALDLDPAVLDSALSPAAVEVEQPTEPEADDITADRRESRRRGVLVAVAVVIVLAALAAAAFIAFPP